MNQEMMKIIVCRPRETAQIVEIPHTLEQMQNLVDGYIQAVYPFTDPVAIVCNDDGKWISLPLNRALRTEDGKVYDIVAGNMFICGLGEDDFTSIPDDLIEKYYDMFKEPEAFIRIGGVIESVKIPERQKQEPRHHRQK